MRVCVNRVGTELLRAEKSRPADHSILPIVSYTIATV